MVTRYQYQMGNEKMSICEKDNLTKTTRILLVMLVQSRYMVPMEGIDNTNSGKKNASVLDDLMSIQPRCCTIPSFALILNLPALFGLESVQRQFVLYANHNRHVNPDEENYRIRPYADRCAELNLQSLARRRANSSIFLVHDVLTGKVNTRDLRERINLYDGSRALRNPAFIRIESNRRDYLTFSPFNFACRLFHLAANLTIS